MFSLKGTFFNVSTVNATGLESEEIIEKIQRAIAKYPNPIKNAMKGAVVHSYITKGGTPVLEFTINFNIPEIIFGPPTSNLNLDVSVQVDDHDFTSIYNGSLNAQYAYKTGKLLIQGNLDQAMRLLTGIKLLKGLKV
ncbi:peroxisomal multifunctional enzyme type 2-like [Lycorma delicatula]|uniref:peroxisomal multifunctional enzyme type 2-like n=1 Tax=Lycorma delicatula TaxID=130591 RepID=UPI003F50E528